MRPRRKESVGDIGVDGKKEGRRLMQVQKAGREEVRGKCRYKKIVEKVDINEK